MNRSVSAIGQTCLARICDFTNFAGGNTSSKVNEIDPLTGEQVEVLWVKGSGGDLGSIKRTGFATLYLEKLLALERIYKGVDFEDDMVAMYRLCTFADNPVAASIDTPLHGFLPFPHVDHLHPDWGIALAASANGKEKMDEFNREFNHSLIWIPWQRPGFELGLMMRKAVLEESGMRRDRARRTRSVYVGRDAARMLSEHDHDDRSDRTIHCTTRRGEAVRHASAERPYLHVPIARILALEIRALSPRDGVSSTESMDRQLQRCARRAAVRELRTCGRTGVSRNQLP